MNTLNELFNLEGEPQDWPDEVVDEIVLKLKEQRRHFFTEENLVATNQKKRISMSAKPTEKIDVDSILDNLL